MEREADRLGVRPLEDRRYTKREPACRTVSEDDAERAYWTLTESEVRGARETRERLEWEERNGKRPADEPPGSVVDKDRTITAV